MTEGALKPVFVCLIEKVIANFQDSLGLQPLTLENALPLSLPFSYHPLLVTELTFPQLIIFLFNL